MSVMKVSAKPRAAASSANVDYITRESAATSISFHNLHELESGSTSENRYSAIAYAEERQSQEENMPGCRNHYRLILSFDRDVPSEDARALAHTYLDQEFPNAKAIIAIHQHNKSEADREKIRDCRHTHAHVWIDAREVDGMKIQIKGDKFKTLDERWQRLYDKEYETNYEQEFGESKAQTAEWKQEYGIAKVNGLEMPEKSDRAADKFHAADFREKDLRDIGVVIKDDKERTGIGESLPTIGFEQIDRITGAIAESERASANSQYAIESGKSEIDRGASALESTVGTSERAAAEISASREAGIEELREHVGRLADRSTAIEFDYNHDL